MKESHAILNVTWKANKLLVKHEICVKVSDLIERLSVGKVLELILQSNTKEGRKVLMRKLELSLTFRLTD